MIEAQSLTKRYGEKVAVDHLSFSVEPGKVTGFLGPNGAGKTTTMRLILGLDHPSVGTVTVNGKAFRHLAPPMREAGVNGLDREGIRWIRNLMKALAAEGRTVFVSSHLMSEMENTADHLLVIGRGKLI